MTPDIDFAAAWGEGDGAPPELPGHVWDTIAAGERIAGLVEPAGSYGRLTAVMALGPRETHDYAAGVVGFRLCQGTVVALTFLPARGCDRGPVDVAFDLGEPNDRAVMLELVRQPAMTAIWIDVSEMLVVRRARLALDGARQLVTSALSA